MNKVWSEPDKSSRRGGHEHRIKRVGEHEGRAGCASRAENEVSSRTKWTYRDGGRHNMGLVWQGQL